MPVIFRKLFLMYFLKIVGNIEASHFDEWLKLNHSNIALKPFIKRLHITAFPRFMPIFVLFKSVNIFFLQIIVRRVAQCIFPNNNKKTHKINNGIFPVFLSTYVPSFIHKQPFTHEKNYDGLRKKKCKECFHCNFNKHKF